MYISQTVLVWTAVIALILLFVLVRYHGAIWWYAMIFSVAIGPALAKVAAPTLLALAASAAAFYVSNLVFGAMWPVFIIVPIGGAVLVTILEISNF
jgi:Na+/glutamate symporter